MDTFDRAVTPLFIPNPTIEMGYKNIRTMRELMSGEGVLFALEEAIEEFSSVAPEDHDVVILAHNITVTDVSFIEPHSFVFKGFNCDGHSTIVVVHYTQLVAHVVSRPKVRSERIITGFAPIHSDDEENEDG